MIISFIWIGIAVFVGICRLFHNKNISTTKSDDTNIVTLMLRIIAKFAFEHSRNINLKNLTSYEKEALYRIVQFAELIGIESKDDIEFTLEIFVKIVSDKSYFTNESVYKNATILSERLEDNVNILEGLYKYLHELSLYNSDSISNYRRDLLQRLPSYLKINSTIFENLNNSSAHAHNGAYDENDRKTDARKDAGKSNFLKKYYNMLNCSEDATISEIKSAYRKFSLLYHPDVLLSKGLPPDLIKIAEEKFRNYTDAKDILIKHLSENEVKTNKDNFSKSEETDAETVYRQERHDFESHEKSEEDKSKSSTCGTEDEYSTLSYILTIIAYIINILNKHKRVVLLLVSTLLIVGTIVDRKIIGLKASVGKENLATAFHLYQKAADNGNMDACLSVGNCYQNGTGVKQDYLKAFYYYTKALDLGNIKASAFIGFMYLNGLGVDKDLNAAYNYYYDGADANDPNAQVSLGTFYYNGVIVNQNYSVAKRLYEKAAKQGNSDALLGLASIYFDGAGVDKNYELAFRYFAESSEKGNFTAEYFLGLMYENGFGTPVDTSNALRWYRESARGGYGDAKRKLELLNKPYSNPAAYIPETDYSNL